MPKQETLAERHSRCESEGSLVPLAEPDIHQIKTMVKFALGDLQAAKDWVEQSPKDGPHWNAIFRLYYDILHQLIEAFLQFDKLKIRTHECLFAYLCKMRPELDLSWQFLEDVRKKRNRSIYYGEPATYQDWKRIELQINLYINAIKKAIEEKLNE